MNRRLFRILIVICLLALCLYAGLIFIPRNYPVPKWQVRADVRYWNLPTGSRIGYTLLPARTLIRQPYPIIFLQGGPGGFISERTIHMLAPLADDGYDIYLYDQIGGGHSARLASIRDYTATRHIQDLEAIVQTIGAARVILIGQSWGAILAALYVADNPDRVAKIIFTGPGPLIPQRSELTAVKAPDSLHLRAPILSNQIANVRAANLRSNMMQRCAWWFGEKLASDEEADAFQTILNNGLTRSTVCDTSVVSNVLIPGGGYYAQIMTVASFATTPDPRQKLRNATMPVLVMKGQCDNQAWGFTKEYLDLFAGSRLVVIPGAGHSIAIEQPDAYLAAIRTFLVGNQ